MALTDELYMLHDVQVIDSQIFEREQALKALDDGELLKQQAIEILKQHDAAKIVLQKAEGELRAHELELKGIEAKRATVHEKLYSGRITNPKELGDLQKDEEMLDEQIGRLEEKVLEAMDAAESARATESDLATRLALAKRKWQETVAHAKSETARLQKEIAALKPQRAEKAALVDQNLLRRYDGIRAHRDGVGMAIVDGNKCPVCHVAINTTQMGQLREAEELVLCANCGRMLVKAKAEDNG